MSTQKVFDYQVKAFGCKHFKKILIQRQKMC
jgi:hypothetical protein